jgi:Tfp pilus assembly protein PilE
MKAVEEVKMKRAKGHIADRRGVTLVELLVGVIVLTLAILAIIAVVTKGRELQVTDNHRRQARAIIDSLMEAKYDDRDYALISDTTVGRTHTLGPGFAAMITEDVADQTLTVAGDAFPVKVVTITVRWNEAEGADSIGIQKIITRVRQKF